MLIFKVGSYYKLVGVVTDLCPVCKRRRHFIVHRRKFWFDLYFVPIIPGLPTGYTFTCETCGMSISRHPRDYPQLEKRWWGWRVVPGWIEPPPDEDELSGEHRVNDPANPFGAPAVASQEPRIPGLEARNKMDSGGLPREDRLALIREQFIRINIPLEMRAKEPHFDKASGRGCAAAFLLPAIPLSIGLRSQGSLQTILCSIAGGLFVVLFISALWKLHTDVPRWFRREWLPLIAMQIAPMQPTLDEIEAVIGEFRQLKLKLGKVVNPREVYDMVQTRADK